MMCQASSTHPHLISFGRYILSVNIFIKIMPTHSIKQKVLQIKKERNVQICCFPYLLTLIFLTLVGLLFQRFSNEILW
ncbi:hypothetical protein HMPREF1589_02141 [Escherichia coli 113290]|nr:hypothetical protein HMPREF1589_02141 [Escherichia coli 113290]